MIKIIIILLVFQINCVSAKFRFNHISVADGLPVMVIRKIHQDVEGFMWFGTSLGLVKYDGYNVENINNENGDTLGDIWSITNDSDGSVLFTVLKKGIYRYKYGKISKIISIDDKEGIEYTAIKLDINGKYWIGTNFGIYQYDQGKIKQILSWDNQKFYSFVENDQYIFAQTANAVYKISLTSNLVEQIDLNLSNNVRNNVLYQDDNNIYLGRADGLFKYEVHCKCFKPFINELKNKRVYSLLSDEEYLWIGTLYGSLYRYNKKTSELLPIKHDKDDVDSLSGDSILSLYLDKSKVLWVGTFHGGVNYINRNNFEFNIIDNNSPVYSCIQSNVIYKVLESNENVLWLATQNGLVKILDADCKIFKHSTENQNTLSSNTVSSLSVINNDLWVTNTQGGFDKVNQNTNEIERLGVPYSHLSFTFIMKYNNGLLMGSYENGLYYYNYNNKKLESYEYLDERLNKTAFYSVTQDENNNLYFATGKGIAKLNDDEKIEFLNISFNNNVDFRVTALKFDNHENLWVGYNYQKLLKIKANGSIVDMTNKFSNKSINVSNILVTEDDFIWITAGSNLYKFNVETDESRQYSVMDGLPNSEFLANSIHKGLSGKIYFGGRNGAISFNPNKISVNETPPETVLTAFSYFNNQLRVGERTESGLSLNKPINETKQIKLGYKDYIIGFEFAALDYADSMRNQYAYRLKGLYDDWVYVDANERKATYTNLSPGDYTFQVKASNKDGMWSKIPKELKIKVYPAPWFSPWAYFAYFVIVILSIWVFIRYRTIASRKRAQQLEVTVEERTQEVNLQKKMVETLLDHKNEVFANITHEFKTPLALILGPTEQLVDEVDMPHHSDKLNMIQRNAKRLMLMVGQILKLSQAEIDKEVIRESQAVQPTLTMLYESFKPLAKDKGIEILLKNDNKANVYATAECLEIVLGNLLSNALKFSNSGGKIVIESELKDNHISMSVKDSGTGIDNKDLDKVFKRFVRLDTHKSIQGTGIGLAVVKEITEANNGQVIVKSQWGKGSEFIVTFPLSDIEANEELSQVMVDQLVSNTENELSVEPVQRNNTSQKTNTKLQY